MKRWFLNLNNKTKTIIVAVLWIMFLGLSFVVTSDYFEKNSLITTVVSVIYIFILLLAIVFSVWKSKFAKEKRESFKTNLLCELKRKEHIKKYLTNKFNICMAVLIFVSVIAISIVFGFSYDWLFAGISFAMFALTGVFVWIILFPFMLKSKAISYVIDGVEVGAFYVKVMGIKERSFYLALVIGDKVVSEDVAVRRIEKIMYADDLESKLLNLIFDTEDAYYISKETKSKEAIIKISDVLNEKNITLITNKYTRRLKLFVDGKAVESVE